MKFPFRELHGFEDAQRNFEVLEVLNPLSSTKNLSDLGSIATALTNLGLPDGTGKAPFLQLTSVSQLAVALGEVTLAWTASNLSATATITHGLGRTPLYVLATAHNAPAAGEVPAVNCATYTGTTFVMNGDVRLSGSFNCNVVWAAIG